MEKYALNKKQIILFLASIIASTIAFIYIILYVMNNDAYAGIVSLERVYIFISAAYLLLLIVPILMITKYKTYKEPKKILIAILIITPVYIWITFTANSIFIIPFVFELAFVVFYYN